MKCIAYRVGGPELIVVPIPHSNTLPMRHFSVLLLLLFAGCASEPAIEPGLWRATFETPGGELPFTLELVQTDDGLAATYINGDEHVSVEAVEQRGDRLVLRMPAFNTTIDAQVQPDGSLAGTMDLVRHNATTYTFPFAAIPATPHRFFPASDATPIDVSGRWAVTFTSEDGGTSPAVAELRQTGATVQGTFLTPTADHRYLAGEVRGDSLYLSCFDGSHVFLYKAALQGDGTLAGSFWSGQHYHARWEATRDPAAALPDAYALTYLKDGYERFDFTFPDMGGTPVSLSDPRFADKVVVVTLAGSWCPNCHDEAAFMADFYETYRDRGLEVVALMYEHYDDPALAREQVQAFRDKFGLAYPTLIAGSSVKTAAAETLPMLNTVLAFPTTIFIDRAGQVRRIHTGFSGPGTGVHYETLTREFTTFVEELLAEPVA